MGKPGRKQAEALGLGAGLSPMGDPRPSLGRAVPHLQLGENVVTALEEVPRRQLSLLLAGGSQKCRARGGRTGQWGVKLMGTEQQAHPTPQGCPYSGFCRLSC